MLKLPIYLLSTAYSATNLLLHICNIIFFAYGIYNIILCAAGFFPMRGFAPTAKQHRFAAVISARNEENVLPYLLQSIRQADYPAELIDIIVIADNCSDATAQVAADAGATVLIRNNLVDIGKGHALRWAFERIFTSGSRDDLGNIVCCDKNYDAFCIFDADNLVHPQFFSEMNRAFAAGGELVQGYRNSKNASDSWIATSHSCFYWLQNRFFNQARSKLGLSASINGTGFMIAAKLVREKGWPTQTITEDIETTVLNVLEGRATVWAAKAIVYDEQPLSFNQSWRQRNRWSLGNLQCLRLYGARLLANFVRQPSLQTLDTLIFLLPVPLTLLTALWTLVQLTNGMLLNALPTSLLLASGMIVSTGIVNASTSLFASSLPLPSIIVICGFSYLMTAGSAILSVQLESRRQLPSLIGGCLLFPLFLFSWFGINMVILKNQKQPQWKPINHVRAIHIDTLLDPSE